jgi:hypothetical protein
VNPVCDIKKEVYVPCPEPHVATTASVTYIGEGLTREETRSNIRSSDWHDTRRRRLSHDNGRTWSEWKTLYIEVPTQGGYTMSGGPGQGGTGPLDPVSGRLIKRVFQRIVEGDPKEAMGAIWSGSRLFSDHGFYQLSSDNGETWGEGRQFKYEDGPDFDPDDWGNPEFWRTNEMYIGHHTVVSNGTVVASATVPVPYSDEKDEGYPSVFPNNYREGCVAGAMCFVGRWNPGREDYDWTPSSAVCLPRRVSTRGLVELDISELSNGNLMLVMRGSNTGLDSEECPARKWLSVSKDGGHTWSDVTAMCYDTGEQFYSPATFVRTIRSSKTDKLYCVGNFPDAPPDGNGPRYPLQIAEVDETIPALKRDTVTLIDDRDPERDSEHVQLSNFGLLENRETQEIELYLTRLGERGTGPDTWTADTYRYTLEF